MTTPAWLVVLRRLRDEDEEMVYERGACYVGNTRFAARTAFRLFREMAVSAQYGTHVGEFERYRINETGERLLVEAGL